MATNSYRLRRAKAKPEPGEKCPFCFMPLTETELRVIVVTGPARSFRQAHQSCYLSKLQQATEV
jgi:hypothetical protein